MQTSFRQQLTEKYGTAAFGSLTTNEEKERLYKEESPEYYALEQKRDAIRSELSQMDLDTDEAVALAGELDDVLIKISILDEYERSF